MKFKVLVLVLSLMLLTCNIMGARQHTSLVNLNRQYQEVIERQNQSLDWAIKEIDELNTTIRYYQMIIDGRISITVTPKQEVK